MSRQSGQAETFSTILITLNYSVEFHSKNQALIFFHISTQYTLTGEKFLLIQNQIQNNYLKLKNWDSNMFHYICNIPARINIVSFTREQ